MATLILIFAFLSIYHFILEGLVLPTLRTELAFKIINLRSQFISIAFSKQKYSDESIFIISNVMALSVNKFHEHNIFGIFLTVFRKRYAIQRNKLQTKVFNSVTDFSKDSDIQPIMNEYKNIVFYIFLVNTAGWLIYLLPVLPIVILMWLFKFCVRMLPRWKDNTPGVRTIIAFEMDKKNISINKHQNIPVHVDNSSYFNYRSEKEQMLECY